MDWINLSQGREKWRAVVNTVIIFGISSNAGYFLTTAGTVSVS